ncbi:MAG TPA: DUF4037 domain-containing protein [Kofleriaceae bacterium]
MTGPSGLSLAREFFAEVVAPELARRSPQLRYTAGRFGARSDVLGYDDAISRDHGWGADCMVLVEDPDVAAQLGLALRACGPTFRGYPAAVEVAAASRYFDYHLGAAEPVRMQPLDWLAIDEQKLLEVTSGVLLHDDLDIASTRRSLAYYSDDLRRHLLAVEWQRIAEEQAVPGRAGARGDEIGSAIVATRLAESAVRIAFYIERCYPPYSKWLGTAFEKLACAPRLGDPIRGVVTARDWDARDRAWTFLLHGLLALHVEHGLLLPDRYAPGPVYAGRPGTGLPALQGATIGVLVDELRAPITDPAVLALPRRLGSVNQMLSSRDLEDDCAVWRARYRALAAMNRAT